MSNYAGKTNINVQEITIIPITDEDEGTYGTALDLTGRARSASYTPNVKETKLYGDGEVQEKVIDATEGTLTLALNYLTDSDRQTLFGETAQNGGSILFVGTKKQAQEAMREEAIRCNQYYVNERWLGGMMTNFKTIQKRVTRLRQLEKMEEDGTFDVLPKKEVLGLRHEMEKLNRNLGGIKEMKKLPAALFVVDPRKEHIAVLEARKLNIPIVATVDTNCDPDEVDYVIPANDDAIRAVRLLASKMADAVLEGRQGQQTAEAETADVPAEETAAEAE